MNIKLNHLLIPLLIVSLIGNVLFYFKIGELEEEIKKVSQNQLSPAEKNENQDQNNNITYKTFSSPKADFTFEYPSDWVYDEEEIKREINNTTISTMFWSFYSNFDDIVPYLEVSSPGYEVVDFYSAGYKGTKRPYQLNTFPTNDSETYVTYEHSGSGDGGYIYWQKGKAFASSYCIDMDDFYSKVNIMICHGSDELKGQKVAQHIAKSIKIK